MGIINERQSIFKVIDFGFARFIDLSQNYFCPDPLRKKFAYCSDLDRGWKHQRSKERQTIKKIPGAKTYRLLRSEITPRSDLFEGGVVAVDLFTNCVEDESLFEKTWQEVLPLSDPFIEFLEKLLR